MFPFRVAVASSGLAPALRAVLPALRLLCLALLVAATALPSRSLADNWSTLAGPDYGSALANGSGAAVRFLGPLRMIPDKKGNYLVADGQLIRRVSPDGVTTTVARPPFWNLSGIAIDSSGTLYASVLFGTGPAYGSQIYRIAPDGTASLYAGIRFAGRVDGPVATASFGQRIYLAADAGGNLFVGDPDQDSIRKITPQGMVSTVLGPNSAVTEPHKLIVDRAGNIFVVSRSQNNAVWKVTPTGSVSLFAGTASAGYVDSIGTAARFREINDLCFDQYENIYVSESNRIRRIDGARGVTTVAGNGQYGGADGTALSALLANPQGLSVSSNGEIFFCDNDNLTVRKLYQGQVTTVAGKNVRGTADGPSATARFLTPRGIVEDRWGNVFVSDSTAHTIRKITPDGRTSTFAGQAYATGSTDGPGGFARFNSPTGMAIASNGDIYVADAANHRIRRISGAGNVSTVVGSVGGYADGPAASALLRYPTSLCFDASDNLYIVDTNNNLIRRLDRSGVVTSMAGLPGVGGHRDGNGRNAILSNVRDITRVASGDFYFSENSLFDWLRKLTPGGDVTTLLRDIPPTPLTADSDGLVYYRAAETLYSLSPGGSKNRLTWSNSYANGTAHIAGFGAINGLHYAGRNRIYLADSMNANIRLGVFETGPVRVTASPANVALTPGSPAQFKVSASGEEAISYQWMRNGRRLVNDSNISGATSDTLVFSAAQFADAGTYSAVVTNPLGSVESAKAILTVSTSPPLPATLPATTSAPVFSPGGGSVSVNLAGNSNSPTLPSGPAVVFPITPSGNGPFSYQWRKDGQIISGATLSFLSLSSPDDGDSGIYDVVISNLAGNVYSAPFTLNIIPMVKTRPTITAQPISQRVYPGIAATFRVRATGAPRPTYQ